MAPLTEAYFRPKAIEGDGRLYEWLGLIAFKRLLMRSVDVDPEDASRNAYVLAGRDREALLAFEKRTRRSELIHLSGLGFAALFLALGFGVTAVMFAPALILLAANFHCFALQRYNRIRIYRVLARLERRVRERGCRLEQAHP